MILLDFSSWWAEKEMLEQIYWCFAIPSSLAFVIIILATFIGGDVDGDAGDADMDVGRILSQATGAAFRGVAEDDLAEVLQAFSQYFGG